MAGRGLLGLLPYLCIDIIWVSNQKSRNKKSAEIMANEL